MIKFFRKIRQTLIDKGNIKKYLIYGIGEILLIMIGIFLAIQFNDVYTKNKNAKIEKRTLRELKQEFINNANQLNQQLELKETRIKQWEEYINQMALKEPNFKMFPFGRPQGGAATFLPDQKNLDKLMFTGKIDNIENDTLHIHLSSWNKLLKDYQTDEKLHQEHFYSHIISYESEIVSYPLISFDISQLDFKSPFYSEDTKQKMWIDACSDLKYQNLALRNILLLGQVRREGTKLEDKLQQIIALLDKELNE